MRKRIKIPFYSREDSEAAYDALTEDKQVLMKATADRIIAFEQSQRKN